MFSDRSEAGRCLGGALAGYRNSQPLILALPRGGVPVAVEVAAALGTPATDLDVLVVRKIGAPWNPEFAVGAVGEDDVAVIDADLVADLGIDEATVRRIRTAEAAEVRRRIALYRSGRPAAEIRNRTVIVVDDGIATGSTLLTAVALLQSRGAGRIVVAAPVASNSAVAALRAVADEVVVSEVPVDFRAVGLHYRDFRQVPDSEVRAALDAYRCRA